MTKFLEFDFLLVQTVVSATRELMVTGKAWVSLLNSLCFYAMLVIVVAHRHYSWVGLLITSILRHLYDTFWYTVSYSSNRRLLGQFQFGDFLDLFLKYVES